MGKHAAAWFRAQHACNAYCRDGRHAQMVFLHEATETLDRKKHVSDRRYHIRTVSIEPAPEFDASGYCVREWDSHDRPRDNADDPGSPYLLIYEYAAPPHSADERRLRA